MVLPLVQPSVRAAVGRCLSESASRQGVVCARVLPGYCRISRWAVLGVQISPQQDSWAVYAGAEFRRGWRSFMCSCLGLCAVVHTHTHMCLQAASCQY